MLNGFWVDEFFWIFFALEKKLRKRKEKKKKMRSFAAFQLLSLICGVLFVVCEGFASKEGMCMCFLSVRAPLSFPDLDLCESPFGN